MFSDMRWPHKFHLLPVNVRTSHTQWRVRGRVWFPSAWSAREDGRLPSRHVGGEFVKQLTHSLFLKNFSFNFIHRQWT